MTDPYNAPLGRAITDLRYMIDNAERPSPFGQLNTRATDLRNLRFSMRPFETRDLAREHMAELVLQRGIGQAMIYMQEQQAELERHAKGRKP